jgi:hypothetical protein
MSIWIFGNHGSDDYWWQVSPEVVFPQCGLDSADYGTALGLSTTTV